MSRFTMRPTYFLLAIAAFIVLMGGADSAHGYALELSPTGVPLTWPSGTITMNLQLDNGYPYPEQNGRGGGGLFPVQGLQDFSSDWNSVAQAALNDWNQYLSRVQFVSNTNVLTPSIPDGVNSVFFSSSAYGQSFGGDAIAVTLIEYHPSNNTMAETDVIVNTAYSWDSYRGNLQYPFEETLLDIRRVLDHEFGHVLGLDHPDEATPPQNVVAIMNSTTSDLDHIEVDDINGVMSLYGVKTVMEPISVTATPSNGGTVTGNGNFQLGSTQTLTAIPAAGYAFEQWDDGTTNPVRKITVPLGGANYTATFAPPLDVWTQIASSSVTNFGSVFYFNSTFMVFGDNGVVTSTDGVTWTSHVATTDSGYNTNAVAYHGGTYVSVGNDGDVWTSSDGFNWTNRQTAFTADDFYAVTYANGLYVAVGGLASNNNGTAPVMTSPDGITWTLQTQGVPVISEGFTAIIYANGQFVAVGATSLNSAATMTSPDGITWTPTVQSFYYPFTSITYGEGQYVAANYFYHYTSPDGANWTQQAVNASDYRHVAYGNGVFASTSAGLETSPDGVAWTYQTAPNLVYYPASLAYGNGRFVCTSNSVINPSGLMALLPASVLPAINGSLSRQALTNLPASYQITAANAPLAFNAVGLPPGMRINEQTGAITGTPTVTGTYSVKLYATNDAGSGTATLTLTVGTGPTPQKFSAWVTANGVTGLPTDTPKGDSVPNELKYFYDINPTTTLSATDRAALPVLGTGTAGTMLTLTYRENKAATTVVDVVVESSTDLQSWGTPTGAAITATGAVDPATGDPMMQAQVPITHAARQFIRIVVSPQ